MKVIAFDAPSFTDEFTTVRVYDTDTGALIQGVAGIPFTPTNGNTIIVGVYENYIFGYCTVQDEAEGKDAITDVFRSLIGVTPGSPITTTLAGDPNTRLIDDFYSYARGSTSVHLFINNASETSHRLANITIGPGGVSYSEQALGTMTTTYDNTAMVVEFADGARRLVVIPPLGDNLLRYSSVVGSGSLNIAGTVTMYTGVDATTSEEGDSLGLTNTGRLANALSAFGTITRMQSLYVFAIGGVNDGTGLNPYYPTGLTGGQLTQCYVVEPEIGGSYTPRADLIAFDGGFTTNNVVASASYPVQPIPPFVSSVIPSPLVSVSAFWTQFKRAEEQP